MAQGQRYNMAYFFSPISTMQFEDANGVPYSGAKLFTYAAGTTTKQTTYQTSTGTANTNPIILNSQGRPPYGIWTVAGEDFHYFLAASTDTDPPVGAAIYEADNVESINDITSSVVSSEWLASGLTPSYISWVSFSVPGDYTGTFTVGRKLKCTVTAGTVYHVVRSATYAASITTVVTYTVATNLDSGLSAVSYGIINPTNTSLPNVMMNRVLYGLTADGAAYTSTEAVSAGDYRVLKYEQGVVYDFCIDTTGGWAKPNTGAATLNINGIGSKDIKDWAGGALTAGSLLPGVTYRLMYYVQGATTFFQVFDSTFYSSYHSYVSGQKNCTIFAPVTSAGLTNLGGSTGSATVTTTTLSSTAPLVVNASNILQSFSGDVSTIVDEVGYSTANLSWTGLTTDGTMYLYVDVTEKARTLTTGSTTLAPVYQYAGTPSTTSGQATYNTSNNVMYLGNGSTAPQARRVFVGEVTVAANVVSAITWYTINRHFEPAEQAYVKNTKLTFTHNLGIKPKSVKCYLKCTTIDNEYAVGDIIDIAPYCDTDGALYFGFSVEALVNTIVVTIATSGITLPRKTTAQSLISLTPRPFIFIVAAPVFGFAHPPEGSIQKS